MMAKPSVNVERSLRLVLALVGGYVFAAGFVALVAAGLPHLGMANTESTTLGGMLGMLVYLTIMIWAVASTRPLRAAVIVFVAAALMILLAPMLVVSEAAL